MVRESQGKENEMSCPTDLDLLDYATGKLTPSDHESISNHLTNCPACQERVSDHRLLATALSDWTGKSDDCFDFETLRSFVVGALDHEASTSVASHLENCVFCKAEANFLQMDSPAIETEFPAEHEDRVLDQILGRLQAVPLLDRIRADFRATSRSIAERFIRQHHPDDLPMFHSLWNLISDRYGSTISAGQQPLGAGAFGVVGADTESEIPAVCVAALAVSNQLSQSSMAPSDDELEQIISEVTSRIGLPRRRRRRLAQFLQDELSPSQR